MLLKFSIVTLKLSISISLPVSCGYTLFYEDVTPLGFSLDIDYWLFNIGYSFKYVIRDFLPACLPAGLSFVISPLLYFKDFRFRIQK